MSQSPAGSATGIDLAALEQLARAATPSPWDFDTAETPMRIAGGEVVGGDALPYGDVYTTEEFDGPDGSEPINIAREARVEDGRFIAAASPATVLALIALARATPQHPEAPADGSLSVPRELLARCMSSMKAAVTFGETGQGRPPAQTCMYEIEDVEAILAGAATPQHSVTEQASIDSDPKFQQLAEYWRGEPYGTRSFENAWAELVAFIDSRAQPLSSTAATQPEQADERALDLYDEIECDLTALFGRASSEGHEAGQQLAAEVRAKMQRARAALAIPASTAEFAPQYETVTDHNGKVRGVCMVNAGQMPPASSIQASTAASEQRPLLDELENAVAGWGGDLVEKIEAIIKKHRAHPDCGACPGNGSVCATKCRLHADSPAAASEQQASVSEDERALYEEWARTEGWSDKQLSKYGDQGWYSNPQVAHEWRVWQARAALSGRATIPSEADERPGLEYRTCCDHPDCTTCAGHGGFYRATTAADQQCDECAGSGKIGPDENPNEMDCEVCDGSGRATIPGGGEYALNVLESCANWLLTRAETSWAKEFSHGGLMRQYAGSLREIRAALTHRATTATPCPTCNGNDANVPCAYPSKGMPGCLRDVRLVATTAADQQGGTASASDDDIKAIAINYAHFVAGDVYDVTKYDCAEDFFNCVRACIESLSTRAPAPSHLAQQGAAQAQAGDDMLRARVLEAWAHYERMGEICSFEGNPMIYASTLEEIAAMAAPATGSK